MRRCRPLLGTFVEITADDGAAIDNAFAAIERIHRLMSAHEAGSELSQVNRFAQDRPIAVSQPTAEVIARALVWSRASGGVFDPVRAGRLAIERGGLPLHGGQRPPAKDADWTSVRLADGEVTLDKPCCLDLGGIAKGYAVDQAIAALREAGAARGLVNAGGDLGGFGPESWPIIVPDPRSRRTVATIELIDAALATSAGLPGDDDGLSFDHLPDRARDWVSVTVRAPNACDADALAKIAWALGDSSGPLLDRARAQAFAIRGNGQLEPVGAESVTA